MTNSTEITLVNSATLTPEDALKAVRSAGTAEHGAHSKLAHALKPAMEQAFHGNLDPVCQIAKGWSGAARKAANTVLKHVTEGDLSIRAATAKSRGVTLAKGWADRKVDNWDFAGLATLVTESMPTNKAGPVEHRANIYKMAKSLSGTTERPADTLDPEEIFRIAAENRHGIPQRLQQPGPIRRFGRE